MKFENKVPYIQSFQQSTHLINFSLKIINNWECDILILEEFLRINHRGWELFFKTYRHLFSKQFSKGHSLIKQIEFIENEKIVWHEELNLKTLFESKLYKSYFKLLDSLFSSMESRYANINDIIDKKSKHCLVDYWLKEFDLITKDGNMYSEIKEIIIEINLVTLKYLVSHFYNHKDQNIKFYSSLFNKNNNYWNDKFL